MQYAAESTIDYEYLKTHDKMQIWLNNSEMTTLDDKHNSICSTGITNEEILDYLVHGHNVNTDNYNTSTLLTHDIGYCTNTEGYDANTRIKNDTGYYSGSNESLTHGNRSYIPEDVAFHNTTQKTTSNSAQEESHVDCVIEEETLAQSPPLQTIAIPNGYVTLENQYQSHTQNTIEIGQGDCFSDSTASPIDVLVKEINENRKSPAVDSFPYTATEISPTSPVSVEEKYGNENSPAVSEGEYLPYTTAIDQCDSSTVTKLTDVPQSCSTEIDSAVSMELTKQGTPITDSFPYVTLYEKDTHHTTLIPLSNSQHSCASTEKKNSTNINAI